jgi:putative membrane protein insertion efficiency factor
VKHLVLVPVRLYQILISPWMPACCRYFPSCSNYMVQAVERHGVLKGTALGTWRLLRCAPWGGHGYDPVPGTPPPAED